MIYYTKHTKKAEELIINIAKQSGILMSPAFSQKNKNEYSNIVLWQGSLYLAGELKDGKAYNRLSQQEFIDKIKVRK